MCGKEMVHDGPGSVTTGAAQQQEGTVTSIIFRTFKVLDHPT